MYSRILLSLDGSHFAEAAVPWASLIAKRMKLPLRLLLSQPLVNSGHDGYLNLIAANQRAQSQGYLDDITANLKEEGLEVSTVVIEGYPADSILREAANEPSTLIVMATHGRSGLLRWTLGSVADRVLNQATTPLLLIRPGHNDGPAPEAMLRNVIVPLDGSVVSEQALPHAAALASALDLSVTLALAFPTEADLVPDVPHPFLAASALENVEHQIEALREQAIGSLERARDQLRSDGVSDVEHCAIQGHPGSVVSDLARDTKDAMIVMTTHGRSGIQRWALGSITDKVVRHVHVPVLVVRATPGD